MKKSWWVSQEGAGRERKRPLPGDSAPLNAIKQQQLEVEMDPTLREDVDWYREY